MEPTEARLLKAQSLIQACTGAEFPPEHLAFDIAQALADEYARGVRAGVDLVLAEVDDWYQHPAGMLLERIRSLKSTP